MLIPKQTDIGRLLREIREERGAGPISSMAVLIKQVCDCYAVMRFVRPDRVAAIDPVSMWECIALGSTFKPVHAINERARLAPAGLLTLRPVSQSNSQAQLISSSC